MAAVLTMGWVWAAQPPAWERPSPSLSLGLGGREGGRVCVKQVPEGCLWSFTLRGATSPGDGLGPGLCTARGHEPTGVGSGKV